MNTAISAKKEKTIKKLSEVDEKIKSLQQEKKDLSKQLKQLEEEEYYAFVKSLDVSMEDLNSDVELGKIIRQLGLTKKDIESLITENKEEKTSE